jgi:DNA-binding NarL/FixJ family response regulator
VALGERAIHDDMATEVRKAKVGLVDDHPLFRQGLAVALGREHDLEVAGEAASAAEAIEIAKRIDLDVVVVDILMPTVSGLSLTSELYELQPRCRVLGLSVIDDPGIIADMLRAHACGYALKTQPVAEIVEAIGQVLGGLRYLPPGVSRDAVEAELRGPATQPLERLTRREREVFELLIRGHSNDEIATQLLISRRTVETHRQRIMNKLSAHSVVQMQRLAARHGGLAP